MRWYGLMDSGEMTGYRIDMTVSPQHSGQLRTSTGIRRTVHHCLSVLFVLFVVSVPIAAEAAPDQANRFMRQVARELIAASKSGSIAAMASVIQRHGDMKGIGTFSLGKHARAVPSNRQTGYFAGVAWFMARYAMNQAKQYRITKVRITGDSDRDSKGYHVATDVTLKDGNVYDVRWHLVKRGKSFKVRDAQVLGFWLVPFQRDIFLSYIQKHNGSVDALLWALGS